MVHETHAQFEERAENGTRAKSLRAPAADVLSPPAGEVGAITEFGGSWRLIG
jgi:hypothetical protein